MSLLPTTALLWRRYPKLASATGLGRRTLSGDRSVATPQSFEKLGLSGSVVSALQEAFPNVQRPTQMQVEFLSAVLAGQDVLLKDRTGTGKSFGLLLALLSQPRRYTRVEVDGKYIKQPLTSSLFIAPHRDLVYQFLHWIKDMYDATVHASDLQSVVQVLLRNNSPITEQAQRIRENPPHILLGTPQAILEAIQLGNGALPLSNLATVIVDEADYLIEHMPKKRDKYDVQKFKREIKRHPSPTRQILDMIYSSWRTPDHRREEDDFGLKEAGSVKLITYRRPQLIMTSATLKSSFRSTMMANASGWFHSAPRRAKIVTPVQELAEEESVGAVFGGSSLLHSALVVSDDGDIRNIKNAVSAPTSSNEDIEPPEAQLAGSEEDPSVDASPPLVNEKDANEFAETLSPFNPTALEAVAATFAVRVPQVALLVLPATAPVRRAVFELRSLGVNAHGLDVVKADSGGSFLLRKGAAVADEPTLLVSTLATTRGIDLPGLTHTFILGMPKELTLEEYLHVAGRVGRFGRAGHVISILEKPTRAIGKKGKTVIYDEASRLRRMYTQLGVTPVKIEEFDPVERASSEEAQ